MEVIVKSSPKIEIEFATKVVKVGGKVTVDSALSTESENPVMNKVVTEKLTELSEKIDNLPQGDEFDKDGNYPSLHVGTADDLAGRGESVPASFGFRASGGKSIKDGRAYIKRIKGNSVVWNQLYAKGDVEGVIDNSDGTGYKYAKLSDLPAYTSAINGHKILAIATDKGSGIDKVYCTDNVQSNMLGGTIFNANTSAGIGIMGRVPANTIANYDVTIQFYDLTKMFQAGNEPTTIEEFNARVATLGVDMNAYNEGQVIHCNTESIKSVGDNAWDEEWELGVLNSTGVPYPSDTRIRTKNFTRVIPNETYFFYGYYGYGIYFYDADKNYVTTLYVNNNKLQIPSNAMYLKFHFPTDYGTTYKGDYMISLVHSGWKRDTDAGYQPYWQDTLPLPIIRKYFPDGMKLAGSAHDEIRFNKASGKWEYSKGRIRSKALSELNWVIGSTGVFIAVVDDMVAILNTTTGIIGKYILSIGNGVELLNNEIDKGYCTNGGAVGGVGKVAIRDNAYTNVDAFKQHLEETNAILYYESNDWEWVELDEADQNFRDYYNVADFGTEEAIPAMDAEGNIIPSAAFSADIIYQFNAVDMIREHELEITELQKVIATMQAQLTALTNGGQ